MYVYIVLDLLVIVFVGLLIMLRPAPMLSFRLVLLVVAILCVMTGVFDSLIIELHFVRYSPQHILGWHIWKAPIEDFAYPLLVGPLVAYLWGRAGHNA